MSYRYYDERIYEPTLLDELFTNYKEECKKILLSSVQNEINEIKNDNIRLKNDNKKLRDEFRNLDVLKHEIEQNKEKLIDEGISAYQREALSGLRCGDTVWTVKTETVTEKCKHCNGTHKIKVDVAGIKKMVDCPHCSYGGYVEVDVTFTPVARKIAQIDTSMWASNKCFKRFLYLEEISGSNRTAGEDYICDNRDGDLKDATERNDYGNNLKRDFWLSEEDCLIACAEKKEKWIEENKKERK